MMRARFQRGSQGDDESKGSESYSKLTWRERELKWSELFPEVACIQRDQVL
jgi:hypothetical protein